MPALRAVLFFAAAFVLDRLPEILAADSRVRRARLQLNADRNAAAQRHAY